MFLRRLCRLLPCIPKYERCPTDDPDAPAGFHRPTQDYTLPTISKERILECVQQLISQPVHVVVYKHGTVYVCPTEVADPQRNAKKVLKKINADAAHFYAQQVQPDLRVFIFGELEGFRGVIVILNSKELKMDKVPHQHLLDVARMFLVWDREDGTAIEAAIIGRDYSTIANNDI